MESPVPCGSDGTKAGIRTVQAYIYTPKLQLFMPHVILMRHAALCRCMLRMRSTGTSHQIFCE